VISRYPGRQHPGIRGTSDGGRGARLPTLDRINRELLEGDIMNRVHRIRRSLAVLAGLAGAVLALGGAAPAFAMVLPPPGGAEGGSADVPAQVITQGGMPGWQIALIAVGAALVAAVAAVLLDRALLARRVTEAVPAAS
jgi:hypothetical protein